MRTSDDLSAFSLDGEPEFEATDREPIGVPGILDEFLALPGKAERVDGRIVLSPPSSALHAEAQMIVASLLQAYVTHRELGHVLGETFVLSLSDRLQRSPDASFFRTANRHRIVSTNAEGGADLVVDIVSPSSAKTDRVTKRAEYAVAGIEEYLLVDPARREVELLRLEGGEYRPVAPDAAGRPRSSA